MLRLQGSGPRARPTAKTSRPRETRPRGGEHHDSAECTPILHTDHRAVETSESGVRRIGIPYIVYPVRYVERSVHVRSDVGCAGRVAYVRGTVRSRFDAIEKTSRTISTCFDRARFTQRSPSVDRELVYSLGILGELAYFTVHTGRAGAEPEAGCDPLFGPNFLLACFALVHPVPAVRPTMAESEKVSSLDCGRSSCA